MKKLSVKEKHIYVTQELQRQGAFKKDKQHPSAIDLGLNIAQSRIIKARLVQDREVPYRFQINQKFVSDIQAIIVRDKKLTTFNEEEKSYGILPYDFSYLLSDRGIIYEDCQAGFTTSTETKTERVHVIPFTSNKTVSPYYINITISKGTTSKNLTYSGFQTKEERVTLVDEIIKEFKSLGIVDIFWEEYKTIYERNSLLVPTTDLTLTVSMTVDGVPMSTSVKDAAVRVFKTSTETFNQAVGRDIKADFLDSALYTSAYHKSIPTSPITLLADNRLIFYGSKRFLVREIILSYIRKPRPISLLLNQGSELSATVHEEICDMAVQIIKKQIEDPSYGLNVNDNKGRIET